MKKKLISLLIALTMSSSVIGLATVYLVTALIPAIAGTIVGVVSGDSFNKKKEKSKEELAKYMKKNHAILVRDVSMGSGPMITEWGSEMGLNKHEQIVFETRLEGSSEQMAMLNSLSGNIDLHDAEVFSQALVDLLVEVIGKDRIVEKIQ